MSVDVVEVSAPIGGDLFKILYVVRLRKSLGGQLVRVHDYGVYGSYDTAMAVKTAIDDGKIIIGLTF